MIGSDDIKPHTESAAVSKQRLNLWGGLARLGTFLDRHLGIFFLLPGLGIILIVLSYPVVSNLYISFTDKHLIYPGVNWIGFENYRLTFADPDFPNSFLNTIVFTFASVSLQLAVGLIAALVLNLKFPGRTFFRLALITPYAFPPVTVSLLWKWILHGLFGAANYLLVGLGLIDEPIAWISQTETAMLMAILVTVWFGFPLFTLAILAGLQSIPAEHYEVARIEGATPLKTFWYVILPSITKIIGIIVVLRTIWLFNAFDLIFALTGGGPVNATETLPLYAYRVGWRHGFIGQTAAIAVILLGVLIVLTWIYFRLFKIEQEKNV